MAANNRIKRFVLGIDGGGTKTIAAVADLSGNVLSQKICGSTNWHRVGEKEVQKSLEKLLKPILKKYNVEAAVFGLAGLDTKDDFLIYQKIVRKVLGLKIKLQIFNDTKIALEALPDEAAKLLIISGTGSNIYGEYKNQQARSGGWDFLLADEGSAYGFGIEAIKAAIRSFDGRGEKTILENLVPKHAKKKHIHDVITEIYKLWQQKPNEFKSYIASFAPIIDRAYYTNEGDRVAKRIIMDGAEELFLGAKAVIEKLGMAGEKICVGFVGSNFKAPLLKDLLSDKIKKIASRAYFVEDVEPVKGAIKLALRL